MLTEFSDLFPCLLSIAVVSAFCLAMVTLLVFFRASVLPAQPPQPAGANLYCHLRRHRKRFVDVCCRHVADLWLTTYNCLMQLRLLFLISSAPISFVLLPPFVAWIYPSVPKTFCLHFSLLVVSPSFLWMAKNNTFYALWRRWASSINIIRSYFCFTVQAPRQLPRWGRHRSHKNHVDLLFPPLLKISCTLDASCDLFCRKCLVLE